MSVTRLPLTLHGKSPGGPTHGVETPVVSTVSGSLPMRKGEGTFSHISHPGLALWRRSRWRLQP